ncbi:MAG: DMT family transporter [Ignavibacteriales bacterium]
MTYGYILAFGSAVFIGLNTVANKIILTAGIDAMTAGAWTYLCASCVFVPLAVRALAGGRRPGATRAPLFVGWLLSGAIGGPVLYFLGLERTTAVHGSILNNLESAFTAVLAFGVFRERLGRRGMAGSLLILLGAAWLSWPAPAQPATAAGGVALAGDVLMAGGYFSWALEANLIRLMDSPVPAVVMMAAKTVTTCLVMSCLAFLKGSRFAVPFPVVPAIVASGGVFLVLSVLLFYMATRLIGAGRAGLVLSTSGFFGTLGSVLFLREVFSVSMVAPVLVISVGIAALMTASKQTGLTMGGPPPAGGS